VCMDSPCVQRKIYFSNLRSSDGKVTSYKGNRKSMPDNMFQAIQVTRDTLMNAGVSVLQGNGYEADDLVMATIQKIRSTGDYETPIDVVTNDSDLLPLVDEQISVFLRSKKATYSEDPALQKTHYVQVRPHNYQEIIEGLSAYKGLTVPYNNLLLIKILRGDSSDNLPGYGRDMPPRHLNRMVDLLSRQEGDSHLKYGMSDESLDYFLRLFREILEWYRGEDPRVKYDDDAVIGHIESYYRGMDLNTPFPLIPGREGSARKAARMKELPKRYSFVELNREAMKLNIHIKPV
jgi:hypothetical protein